MNAQDLVAVELTNLLKYIGARVLIGIFILGSALIIAHVLMSYTIVQIILTTIIVLFVCFILGMAIMHG